LGKTCKPVIVVHGGAGTWDLVHSKPALDAVKEAAKTGFELMTTGGTAVDAVVEAVALMEDAGTFNAGCGSALNLEKRMEMEAAVMDGANLQAGAAALLSDIRNPVRLARVVMEKSDHVFVVGKGADELARIFILERRKPDLSAKNKQYEEQLKLLCANEWGLPKLTALVKAHPEIFQLETAGAVALDGNGDVAASTSTYGFPLKLPGRIGDSPSIGCGTYADNHSGACSATGVGEVVIRLVLAKTVCNFMENGKTPQEAVECSVAIVNKRISGVYNDVGLVALDVHGRIGAAHSSPNLCWAYMTADRREPVVSLKAKVLK
jgi:beta-aspartyl-peptidase (threonine type)